MDNYDFPEYNFTRDSGRRSYFTKINIRILSFAAAIMLIGMGFFLSGTNEKKRLQRETAAVYTRAFSELSAYICSINASLERLLYITSPEQAAAVSSDLFRQAALAKSNLGQLPVQSAGTENIQVFLAQAGDYIFVLAQQAIRENNINFAGEDKANIDMLIEYSAKLAEQLVTMQDGINRANQSGAVLNIIQSLSSENMPPLSGTASLSSAEKIFADYPRLIYNGPFSSGKNGKTYKMLENKREISVVAAREKAAVFAAVPATRLKNKGLTESADIPTFNFSFDNKFIQVAREGGYILNYLTDRRISDQLMSDEDALRAAGDFLSRVIPGARFQATYYATAGGVLIINFAAVQDNIILYPDLIKIGVALDNCEIIFYEANNYLKNHTRRDFPDFHELAGADEAQRAVPPSLEIKSSRLSLIPCEYSDGTEILCYEFKCENDEGRQFIIYVNAKTGRQEDALVIIDTGRGKLVM